MRLIDADALKSKVQAQEWKRDPAVMLALDWIYMLINEQPTIDAVPVVRCRECKHQRKTFHEDKRMKDGGYWMYWCDRNEDQFVSHTINGYDDDYCSCGAKMEDKP